MPGRVKWHQGNRPLPASTVSEVCAVLALYDSDVRRPLNDERMNQLNVAFRLAFLHMLNGLASEENWAICVVSLNIALVLAEWGYGPEYLPVLANALDGASRAKQRALKTGKWGFDGEAIQAIQEAFDIHEAQLEYASQIQLKAATSEVHRRADAGIAYQEAA